MVAGTRCITFLFIPRQPQDNHGDVVGRRAGLELEDGPLDPIGDPGRAHPGRHAQELDQALLRQAIERRFCTVALGRLETTAAGARLTICCGGHPPPLMIRRDGTVEEAGMPGTLLGIYEEVQLSDLTVELHPGDAVVFHTDGVTEERIAGRMFGITRSQRIWFLT